MSHFRAGSGFLRPVYCGLIVLENKQCILLYLSQWLMFVKEVRVIKVVEINSLREMQWYRVSLDVDIWKLIEYFSENVLHIYSSLYCGL